MKISSKVECGLISLVDICIYSKTGVVTVINISARQHISAKYLEQILPQLRQAEIIRSVKGAKGGYTLTRPAEKITLREVINALDRTVLGEVTFDNKEDSLIAGALSECLWSKMTEYLQSFTENVTLRDIADRYDKLSAGGGEPMYYI
ncbi:MAG: Rrf2 family transcriptional regulator [Ruminiclostridium sp.]|nr:Rrf2 family transcriptional regulator [Ruminiclostridium sp.]